MPKMMNILVCWIMHQWANVDSYVDDIIMPVHLEDAVSSEKYKYGLPIKPPEALPAASAWLAAGPH